MSHDPSTTLEKTLKRLKSILDNVKDIVKDDWDPIEVAVLFSKLEYEDLDVDAQMQKFEELGNSLKEKVDSHLKHKEKSLQILKIFSQDFGFSGDKNNYYNIKNSFANDVILRRKGIPISLSLIYMGFCRRMGLKALGVGFPGHFLVKVIPTEGYFEAQGAAEVAEDWQSEWYVDCFDASVLSVKDCEERLNQWTRGLIRFGPEVLKLAHPTEILSRMLRNLRAILMEKEDLPRLYWVLSALIELCPNEKVESYRERGLLMGRMGRFHTACVDLKEYLCLSQDVEKINHVRQLLSIFESQSEFAN